MNKKTTTFSLNRAAKEVGKSKGTISKAISSGKLSAEKLPSGAFSIEPVELFRVFPLEEGQGGEPTSLTPLPSEATPLLEAAVSAAENKLLREQIADLKERLSESEDERKAAQERVVGLLEKVAKTPNLWQRLIGKT